jgi:hypothetical protein
LLDRSEPEVGIWKSDTVINYKARLGTQKLVEVRHASIAAIPIHGRSALRSRPKIMNSGTEQANDKGASWPMPMPVGSCPCAPPRHSRASCPYPRKYCYTYTTETDRSAFVHPWVHCSLTKVALHSQPSKSKLLIVTRASYLKIWQKKTLSICFFFKNILT